MSDDSDRANECSICLGPSLDPVTCHPCAHRFCVVCLSALVDHARSCAQITPITRTVPCPKCRRGILWSHRVKTDKIDASKPATTAQLPGRAIFSWLPWCVIQSLQWIETEPLRAAFAMWLTCTLPLALLLLDGVLFDFETLNQSRDVFGWLIVNLLPVICISIVTVIGVLIVFVW